MTRNDELQEFLDREAANAEPYTENFDEPKVVYRGALELSRDQEDKMIGFVFNRIDELKRETAWESARMHDSDFSEHATLSDRKTFFGKRRLFDLMFNQRVEWRRKWGELFDKSNLHLPHLRRFVGQQASRAQNYFTGTDPWLSLTPQGVVDKEQAEKVNAYAQWKFREANFADEVNLAIQKAFIRGEGVLKVTHVNRAVHYKDFLTVAVSPEGEPLIASDGDYIKDTDTWKAALDEQTGQLKTDPSTGEPLMLLERDMVTVRPANIIWKQRKLPQHTTIYKGPQASLVYYLDFLCDPTARSIDEADLVAHSFDIPATDLSQAYVDQGGATGAKSDATSRRLLEALREASIGAGDSQAADANRPDSGVNLLDGPGRMKPGNVGLYEVWFTYDADGDGRAEEIVLWVNRETRLPIMYDYMGRISKSGRRPFFAVRVNPNEGQWTGNAQVDMFWDMQMSIDLAWNRLNFAQSAAGRVDFWDPTAVFEGDGNPKLKMNSGRSFRLKPGKKAEDALQSKYLSDVKSSELIKEIEHLLQVYASISGVAGPNDAGIAHMDSMKLATGLKHLDRQGQEQFAPFIPQLAEGIKGAAAEMMMVLAKNIDGPELFQYFEGEVSRPEQILPADVRNLKFMVELELTRYKGEQDLQQHLSSFPLYDRYYTLPPEMQELLADPYRQALKLLGVKNPERYIVPNGTPPPMPAGAQPNPDRAVAAAAPRPKMAPALLDKQSPTEQP